MKCLTWIGGWGVRPDAFRPFAMSKWPDAEHQFLSPEQLDRNAVVVQSDVIIAWSLGACRVLDAAAQGVTFPGKVVLLAPFLAFCAEYELGGKCSVIQIRWLRRWIQRDPLAALADFYHQADLHQPPAKQLPYGSAELLSGLDRLTADAVPGARESFSAGLPPRWAAIIGDRDPLLHSEGVAKSLPRCHVAAGVGHSAEALLRSVPEVLDAI